MLFLVSFRSFAILIQFRLLVSKLECIPSMCRSGFGVGHIYRVYIYGSYLHRVHIWLTSSEFAVPSADGTNLFSVYTRQEVRDKVQQGIMYRPNANESSDSYWKCNREQVEFYANR